MVHPARSNPEHPRWPGDLQLQKVAGKKFLAKPGTFASDLLWMVYASSNEISIIR